MDVVERLHRGLDERPTSEAVAALILELLGHQLLPAQQRLLARAAGTRPACYSSMSDDFERPVPAIHKARTLLAVFGLERTDEQVQRLATDPWLLKAQAGFSCGMVGWMPGTDPTTTPRLNRQQRSDIGVSTPARQYRRQVRQIRRTHRQALAMQQQILLRQMTLVARSGLAYSITVEEMRADPFAAAFVCYWVAQRNRRRGYTLIGRDNPFDLIAESLLSRCITRGAATDWWMIARVYPTADIVARLDDEHRGELVGTWSCFMRLAADRLADLAADWPEGFDRATMVVRRGMDSSTWNTVAGAYNAARSGWIECVTASDAQPLLNALCPGKAMRLMAGDLTGWHTESGSAGDRQARVWAALPPPWEVLDGRVTCTARTVELACAAEGLDARLSGWTGPARPGEAGPWRPTPELVHGVQVHDPIWAGLLRRAGAFSGKHASTPAQGPL